MLTAYELLGVIAPDCAADLNRSAAISMGEANTPIDVPVTRRAECVAYYAAHVLTLPSIGQAGGGLTGMTEGGLSKTFAPGDKGLRATVYGQRFIELVDATRGGSILINCCD